ncbi:NAC domain [Quillaja saponaria]|uniref:NAC domain n=1 Tax=Quillaja saponaria TaxID=32244 RepID=A0AAD7LLK7_QUISA|nr:NAC domain [Quillaja saponaria]
MEFPIGYRFQPTDTEVIVHYLSKKVIGKQLPYAIQELDVYEKEPWLIFDKNSRETFYVFTKLKKKKKDSRADRVVGCGTWKGQNCKEIKDDQDDKVIGYNRAFVFQENKRKCSSEFKGIAESNGHWIMHEFSLSDFYKIDKQVSS